MARPDTTTAVVTMAKTTDMRGARRHHALTVAYATGALFVLLMLLLVFRLEAGLDPAIGTSAYKTPPVAHRKVVAVHTIVKVIHDKPPAAVAAGTAPGSAGGSYAGSSAGTYGGGTGGSYSGGGSGGSSTGTAPQASSPAQSSPAPAQSAPAPVQAPAPAPTTSAS